eukprot:CAMPEP_0206520008 /NCGR_PEP_ID=MMETSP0324_2-20121206/65523_1 /ASSEMBLY_ACC=CAM_ASM_000836 /TAXON_ID=2866 /ORGANISM="Crypthecodinium cohnii, Strain Seligo" /LENGTH=80 /DNA_ID=CAMNT_0054013683 /DNA_START=85 /DNA_END=329 /DNA_ORIENTATION=+
MSLVWAFAAVAGTESVGGGLCSAVGAVAVVGAAAVGASFAGAAGADFAAGGREGGLRGGLAAGGGYVACIIIVEAEKLIP